MNLKLIDAFLEDDYAKINRDLPKTMALLIQRRAGRSWHKHGSFKDHLFGIYRALTLWGQPNDVAMCGLFHSVYSNEYVDLALFDPIEGRSVLADFLNPQLEQMIHLFCNIPRTEFVKQLLQPNCNPTEGMLLRGKDNVKTELTPLQVAQFLIITIADLIEHWHSWPEDTMAKYPLTVSIPMQAAWTASLWPRPLRPRSSAMALASQLGRHLPALEQKIPPIFNKCSMTLSAQDESVAMGLYWQVVNLNIPTISPEHAKNLLLQSIALNPFVAEPRLLLAQILYVDGMFEQGLLHARAGLQLICDWGMSWDKRVTWGGWIHWARLLCQKGEQAYWPNTLSDHNNLGLINQDS